MPRSKPTTEQASPAIPATHEYLRRLGLDQMPELLSVNQVMDLLGVSRQLVHRLVARGELTAIRLGPHTMRVFRASLVDYLRRNVAE